MPIPTGVELFYAGIPTNGTNESQRLTVTGTPAGGSLTWTWSGQTTAAIAYNSTAAQFQALAEALSNIDAGEIAASGGPLPGTPIDYTFQNGLGGLNQAAATTADSLTGGSAPASAITTPTPGVRGTYRGASFGTILCDTTNGLFYEQTSKSPATPTWSEVGID